MCSLNPSERALGISPRTLRELAVQHQRLQHEEENREDRRIPTSWRAATSSRATDSATTRPSRGPCRSPTLQRRRVKMRAWNAKRRSIRSKKVNGSSESGRLPDRRQQGRRHHRDATDPEDDCEHVDGASERESLQPASPLRPQARGQRSAATSRRDHGTAQPTVGARAIQLGRKLRRSEGAAERRARGSLPPTLALERALLARTSPVDASRAVVICGRSAVGGRNSRCPLDRGRRLEGRRAADELRCSFSRALGAVVQSFRARARTPPRRLRHDRRVRSG